MHKYNLLRLFNITHIYVFRAEHLELDSLSGAEDKLIFSNHWLPIVIHLGLGAEEISPIHTGRSAVVVIV